MHCMLGLSGVLFIFRGHLEVKASACVSQNVLGQDAEAWPKLGSMKLQSGKSFAPCRKPAARPSLLPKGGSHLSAPAAVQVSGATVLARAGLDRNMAHRRRDI